ncbi:MAG: ATP-binding protein, partial [Spirochaetes bacterium]|nr:ATP-binding protein [Spirochaetota bacterium]
NPVDLDYKALSNAGTWLIGRLQTEQDQQRVLDGLEGAAAGAGARFDRRESMRILAGLKSRTFLMNNVHEDRPVLFESRWAMSYLRGPLTRDQIKRLQAPYKPAAGAGETAAGAAAPSAKAGSPAKAGAAASAKPAAKPAADEAADRPVISPSIPQFFVPARKSADGGETLVYEAVCLGIAKLYYVDAKAGLSLEQDVSVAAGISPELARPEWDEAVPAKVREKDLETVPEPDALFGPVGGALGDPKSYVTWNRDFQEWLFRSQALKLYRSPSLDLASKPGESEQDFRIRLQVSGREWRDELLEKMRQRYAPRIASLQERIRRAEQATEREQAQAQQQKLQTAISVGSVLLGALVGRRITSRSTFGRAATAARGAGRIFKEGQDVQRAEENVQELQKQLEELEAQANFDTDLMRGAGDPLAEQLETIELKPRKTDISVRVLGLGWVPWWRDDKGGTTRAF